MAEKPILFSAPMVLAILEGRKTMTRRELKLRGYKGFSEFGPSTTHGYDWHFRRADKAWCDVTNARLLELLPYHVGDTLWVRETWAQACELDDNDKPCSEMRTYYRADGEPFARWLDPDTDSWRDGIKWRPSIFMPRWASRITLEVTAVKVERLQDISEDDAWAEGAPCDTLDPYYPTQAAPPGSNFIEDGWDSARDWFQDIWTTINGPGAWDANDWVAAYSFKRVT